MRTLNLEGKRKNLRMIGSFLPTYIHEYLTLYTLAKNVTKAKILKSLIEPWIEQQRKTNPDKNLVQELTVCLNMRWKILKIEMDGYTFSKFKEDVFKELLQKGVKPNYVQTIIKDLKQ